MSSADNVIVPLFLAPCRGGILFLLAALGLSGCKPDCHPKYRLEDGNCILIHDELAGSSGSPSAGTSGVTAVAAGTNRLRLP